MVNRVHTESSTTLTPSRLSKWICRLFRFGRKAVASWNHCQIGHRSQYSVERLLAFRDFHQRTSFARAVAICFFTPIPALSVALAIDCIPLNPPLEGLQTNYGVWGRWFCTIVAVSMGLVLQMKEVIEPKTISNVDAVKISLGSATIYVLASIALAAAWRFPIPFGYVLMVGPYISFLSLCTVLVIGPHVLIDSPVLRKQALSQLLIVVTQGVVAVVYPAFSAVFNQLSGDQQTAFIFVMPIIKFSTKQVVAKAAQHLHEYVGVIVVFSVDVFNVFYVAICMQAANSMVTALVFIASDSFHVVVALRDIFDRAKLDRPMAKYGSSEEVPLNDTGNYLRELPGMVHYLLQEKKAPKSRSIRVFAPFPLSMSLESQTFLNELPNQQRPIIPPNHVNDNPIIQDLNEQLEKAHVEENEAKSRSKNLVATIFALKQHEIVPACPTSTPVSRLSCSDGLEQSKDSTQTQYRHLNGTNDAHLSAVAIKATEVAVRDAMQALFHAEYVLLGEYVEFMLPLVYAMYLSVLYQLPVAVYYPHTASLTSQQLSRTLISITIFSIVEFIGFVTLLVVLRRKFGFSPLHQLAFVLGAQNRTLQGHLFVWNLYILHLTLTHYGVDLNAPFK